MTNISDNDVAAASSDADPGGQPLTGRDTTSFDDPSQDPAQAEWEQAGDSETTGTGADPAEIPDESDEVPATDLPTSAEQPETQGEDPVIAELGEDGQGELAPGDV
ncbi:sugar ABC transporter ATPase [uncultured Microbacterium sp.]|uniref:ABC-type sugar transport systems, ATPase components n=1 Tax=uncultured Microbacterium sp. TaxID=191216 RepID=A0A1Y5P7M9_9MICO|nr:sugar ABC transporter ATPase [uncultured Microbacterium sp.]SBS72091.1 ABC-type sugar transport systems, ATPase components [uncultured Microbacterium sp.]